MSISLQKVVVAAALSLSIFAGCGGTQHYEPQSTAPAAGADPKISADISNETQQTHVTLDIPNLAPPDRLAAGGAYFIAWSRHDDTMPWQRVGALSYDEGSRRAQLSDTTVPDVGFDLKVTVESSTVVASPSTTTVTTQRIAKKK